MYGFLKGRVYKRRSDIHGAFGGQQQGGISTPNKIPAIFLFTGNSGSHYGYEDGWSDGVFQYFGEGQSGDMRFVRGNEAVRAHAEYGKDLLLFEKLDHSGNVRFQGAFYCGGFHISLAPDREGNDRQAIVFHLIPVNADRSRGTDEPEIEGIPNVGTGSLFELRERAIRAAEVPKRVEPPETARSAAYKRSELVRAYALARAAGSCEQCGSSAPFETLRGDPFLEVHHLTRLSDGGPDAPDRVAAICPNCHREIHHGRRGGSLNEQLLKAIAEKENALRSA